MIRRIAVLLVCALLATACAEAGKGDDELQVVANPVAASPAVSPGRTVSPSGTVLPSAGAITSVAVDDRTRMLAVAVAEPPSVLLHRLDDLAAAPKTVPVAGPVERLTASAGQLLAAIPTRNQVARITLPDGAVGTLDVPGAPASARADGDRTLVANREGKSVLVYAGGAPPRSIGGQLYSADDVLVTNDGTVVLDRLRSAVFRVDLAGGAVKEGLRAGDGAANAVADKYGRVLVTDVRGGALLAFDADPLLLRQRYPVPGGIYGIAYDGARDLAWVTLTERNEVAGFDVAAGEPVEKYRFPSVRQPNSVAVDERTGRVFVGSAVGEGTQVMQP